VTLVLPAPPTPSDEPPWLAASRQAALARLDALPFPATDEEEWRYSPIGSLDLARFAASPAPEIDGLPAGTSAVLRSLPAHGGGVVVVDGTVRHQHLSRGLAERGVTVGRWADAGALDSSEAHVDDSASGDLFATAAEAFAADPVVIRVPDGVVVPEPLVVVHWTETPGSASYGRVIVEVGRNAEATVLEVEASAPVEALRSSIVDLRVQPAGRLRFLGVQDLARETWRIATHRAVVGQEATLVAMQVALGGGYARTRSECRLVGRGATGDLLALFFGSAHQTLDFRTFQDHEAPDTTSNLLFKGAVADHARSVYTGRIRVHPDGRGTNAFQTNRNLKLGEHAWADSVPNLEIENNDVRCSHASTVGPVDEEQRFYLESRGIPPRVAERLIVTGFFEELLVRLPVPALVSSLRDRLAARFDSVETVEDVA
jgi:Fe-S cluster assembly protein SufD